MSDPQLEQIRGRRILVVEDEYAIAADLAFNLERAGLQVVGPAGSVRQALTLIESEGALDGALLDVNLGKERAFPIADELAARGVPFVFATGYGSDLIPPPYASAPQCEKPVDFVHLTTLLAEVIRR